MADWIITRGCFFNAPGALKKGKLCKGDFANGVLNSYDLGYFIRFYKIHELT